MNINLTLSSPISWSVIATVITDNPIKVAIEATTIPSLGTNRKLSTTLLPAPTAKLIVDK